MVTWWTPYSSMMSPAHEPSDIGARLITASAAGIGWRAVAALGGSAATQKGELGIGVSVAAILATLVLLAYQRFVQTGVPYRVIGGPRFYERAEIRDAMAYLRCVVSPTDDLAFERIVNTPKRGLGDTTIRFLNDYARRENIPVFEVSARLVETEDLKPKARKALFDVVVNFQRWQKALETKPHTELAEQILEESGYTDMWKADKSAEAPGRLENLKELIRSMESFDSMRGFLEHVSLVMDAEQNEHMDAVSIMTLHSAKGLEFDTVFLPGWEEGLFPHQRALDEGGRNGLEEERRLAYVGLTRAKHRLHIWFVSNRRIHGLWQSTIPSRFLDELPEDHVEIAGRDRSEIGRERRGVLRHERHADLMAVLVLEFLPGRDDARVVVAEGDRAEPAEEVEDLAAVLGDVVHALGAIDEDLVEAEQLQEMHLARVDVTGEELLHRLHVELLGLLDAVQLRAGRRGHVVGLESGHAHAATLLGACWEGALAASSMSSSRCSGFQPSSRLAMENFCWEWDVVKRLTSHVDTGAPLPRELFDRMLAAKNFQSGLQTLRQVEFALFDMRLHAEPGSEDRITELLDEVRNEVSVFKPPALNRFQHSFSHIFAGGYSAGYYSYKWAEARTSAIWVRTASLPRARASASSSSRAGVISGLAFLAAESATPPVVVAPVRSPAWAPTSL
eukprot:gene27134-35641_t